MAGGCGFVPRMPPPLLKQSLCGLPNGTGCGTGSCPPYPTASSPSLSAFLLKSPSWANPCNLWDVQRHLPEPSSTELTQGWNVFWGKAVALGKKNPKYLWFMFFPQSFHSLIKTAMTWKRFGLFILLSTFPISCILPLLIPKEWCPELLKTGCIFGFHLLSLPTVPLPLFQCEQVCKIRH